MIKMEAIMMSMESVAPFSEISDAIKKAESPADFAWAYLLASMKNDKIVLDEFLKEMENQEIDDAGWDVIGRWCKNLGLEDLKEKVFHIPPYVPVSI